MTEKYVPILLDLLTKTDTDQDIDDFVILHAQRKHGLSKDLNIQQQQALKKNKTNLPVLPLIVHDFNSRKWYLLGTGDIPKKRISSTLTGNSDVGNMLVTELVINDLSIIKKEPPPNKIFFKYTHISTKPQATYNVGWYIQIDGLSDEISTHMYYVIEYNNNIVFASEYIDNQFLPFKVIELEGVAQIILNKSIRKRK